MDEIKENRIKYSPLTDIEAAKKRLETTAYLQSRMSNACSEIKKIESEISTMKDACVSGTKLRQLENRLWFWKGALNTFQEIWKFRNKDI